MRRADYMRFVEGVDQSLLGDRTGGLPSHLPPRFPICPSSGKEMAFLVQIYCTDDRVAVRDTLCVQLYQCLGVDDGQAPQPVAVKVPLGATLNIDRLGTIQPSVAVKGIEWDSRLDPDELPYTSESKPEILSLYNSKADGAPAFRSVIPPEGRFLFQMTEDPVNFNFAGLMAIVYLDQDEECQVELV